MLIQAKQGSNGNERSSEGRDCELVQEIVRRGRQTVAGWPQWKKDELELENA
jgi:hypothetical protein